MNDPTLQAMIDAARHAAEHAYVPYSHYPVGAALRTPDGLIFTGCNIENASYPAGICGERTALVKAVSEGHKAFDLLVVTTRDGGSPCGVCRQMLFEFAPDLRVVCVDNSGTITLDKPLRELLLAGFGPDSLA